MRTLQEGRDNYRSSLRSSEMSPTLCSRTAISCHCHGQHRKISGSRVDGKPSIFPLLQLGQADTFQRNVSKKENTQTK